MHDRKLNSQTCCSYQ